MSRTMTRDDWVAHVRNTMDITSWCRRNNITCSECTSSFGPCRKNVAIMKFGTLINEHFTNMEVKSND